MTPAIHIFTKHVLAAALFTVILSGIALQTVLAQKEQSIAVLVNDEPITNFDITQRIRLITVTRRQQPSDALRKKVIEDLISERIQLQAATKAGVAVDQEEVDKVFGNVAKSNNMTGEQLTASLAQLGVDAKTMKEQIRSRIAWAQVVREKFRGQVSVNASQVDQAISAEEPAEGGQKSETEFQLQRVRLELPDEPDQRTLASRLVEADQLRSRVRSCTKIEDTIGRVRKASVKAIGRRSANKLPQPTRAILMASSEGQMTPATITSAGIELYVVCAKRTVNRNDEQRQKVRTKLVTEEYDILARRHLRDLRQEAFIEYR